MLKYKQIWHGIKPTRWLIKFNLTVRMMHDALMQGWQRIYVLYNNSQKHGSRILLNLTKVGFIILKNLSFLFLFLIFKKTTWHEFLKKDEDMMQGNFFVKKNHGETRILKNFEKYFWVMSLWKTVYLENVCVHLKKGK